uniref:Uncharacterized protein n=1 Tax=viral metagenome TaxID=1070528 RepID=A0A6H2A6L6_9ZZZZ
MDNSPLDLNYLCVKCGKPISPTIYFKNDGLCSFCWNEMASSPHDSLIRKEVEEKRAELVIKISPHSKFYSLFLSHDPTTRLFTKEELFKIAETIEDYFQNEDVVTNGEPKKEE